MYSPNSYWGKRHAKGQSSCGLPLIGCLHHMTKYITVSQTRGRAKQLSGNASRLTPEVSYLHCADPKGFSLLYKTNIALMSYKNTYKIRLNMYKGTVLQCLLSEDLEFLAKFSKVPPFFLFFKVNVCQIEHTVRHHVMIFEPFRLRRHFVKMSTIYCLS